MYTCVNDNDIVRIPIRTAFPDYTGKALYEESLEFIQARFREQRKQGPVSGAHPMPNNKNGFHITILPFQEIFVHLTCATDTGNIRYVFNAVTDMLIKNFLKDCGIY